MQAAGLAGTATESYITEIEKLAGATEAQEVEDPEDPGSFIQGYNINASAYTSDGVIAKYLALESELRGLRAWGLLC